MSLHAKPPNLHAEWTVIRDAELKALRCVQVEQRLMKQDPGTIRPVLAPKASSLQAISRAALLEPSSYSISFSSVSSIAGISSSIAGISRPTYKEAGLPESIADMYLQHFTYSKLRSPSKRQFLRFSNQEIHRYCCDD